MRMMFIDRPPKISELASFHPALPLFYKYRISSALCDILVFMHLINLQVQKYYLLASDFSIPGGELGMKIVLIFSDILAPLQISGQFSIQFLFRLLVYSLINLFLHSFGHSFVHTFIHSYINSFLHSSIP